jgi:hypothetical protein
MGFGVPACLILSHFLVVRAAAQDSIATLWPGESITRYWTAINIFPLSNALGSGSIHLSRRMAESDGYSLSVQTRVKISMLKVGKFMGRERFYWQARKLSKLGFREENASANLKMVSQLGDHFQMMPASSGGTFQS